MAKIVHAQSVFEEDVLKELKKRTGEGNTKDAISAAVKIVLMMPPEDFALLLIRFRQKEEVDVERARSKRALQEKH